MTNDRNEDATYPPAAGYAHGAELLAQPQQASQAAPGGPPAGEQHPHQPQAPALPPVGQWHRLPPAMRAARRWLVVDSDKVPYYVKGGRRGDGGELDSPEDVAQLATFDEALALLELPLSGFKWLGFALGDGWQGVDFDKLADRPWLRDTVAALPGYVEVSPSGRGLHCIGFGRHFSTLGSNGSGIEAYAGKRFFTVTGSAFGSNDGTLQDLHSLITDTLTPLHRKHAESRSRGEAAGGDCEVEAVDAKTQSQLRAALWTIPADDYPMWIEVGLALATLGDVGRSLWMEWSTTSAEFDSGTAAAKWRDDIASKPRSISFRSVFHWAKERGWANPESKAAQVPEREPTQEEVEALRADLDNAPPPFAGADFVIEDFTPPKMDLKRMLAELVFIVNGELVAFRSNPRILATTKAMRTLLVCNRTLIDVVQADGKVKATEFKTFDLWLNSPIRETVYTLAFDPSRSRLFEEADKTRYLNRWMPPVHNVPPDWQERVQPFIAHVHYLLPVQADAWRFISFLAHIQQQPGELPHAGWLLISDMEGTGRGLLFRWLNEVWPGYVAQSLELSRVLTDSFTDEIQSKLMLVVDEIDEGSQGAMWKLRPALKRFMTAPVRHMNPKTFKRYTEKNVARMVICSNELTALPIDPRDRRLWVTHSAAVPRPEAYYDALGELGRDAKFIASVWQYLCTFDLTGYSPHDRPDMNDAKRKVIASTKTREQELAENTLAEWPRDLITGSELCRELYGAEPTNSEKGQMGHRARAAGALRWMGNGHGFVRLHGRESAKDTVWIVRNQGPWSGAPVEAVLSELRRPV